MKRRPLKRQNSKRLFTKTAGDAHPKNYKGKPLRGGIRL